MEAAAQNRAEDGGTNGVHGLCSTRNGKA